MRAKIGVVIAGTALTMFALARVDSLTAARGFRSSTAWAQESEDQADDVASQDDAASPADAALQDDAGPQDETGSQPAVSCLKKPGPISGLWSGTVMDNNMGAGMIGASLFQCHSNLSGTWSDTFVPPAFFKGTIKSSGKISARMRFHLFGECGYVFNGVFENGNEISGDYTLNGCKGMAPDSGTLDMFKN